MGRRNTTAILAYPASALAQEYNTGKTKRSQIQTKKSPQADTGETDQGDIVCN